MAARVTVVGSLNVDMIVRAPRIPAPGETIMGSEFHTVPGGKGANQAVAASRLGAQVAMVGRVGGDAHADLLMKSLASDGVDHAFVLRDEEAPTGVALIVLDRAGQNSIVVAPGANGRLSPADVERAEAAIGGADVLLLQLESPVEAVLQAAKVARGEGVTVILNPAPARPLAEALLSLVDVLVPNQSEAALLAEMQVENLAEAQVAGRVLQRSIAGSVVVTLGEQGALLVQDAGAEVVSAYEVEAVDTTAAGDAFVAGLAVALAEGKALIEAVRCGNAAGALAVTRLGAQTSLPRRADVKRLVQGDREREHCGRRAND
jgi:ribokinase